MPETNAHITVKQSVEYVVIDDIDLLILTEDEVDAELEDLEANDAVDDADKSEITGIVFEPWHYRYVGKDAAKEIMEKDITLEEYLAQ